MSAGKWVSVIGRRSVPAVLVLALAIFTNAQTGTVSKDAAVAAETKFRQIQESVTIGQPFGSIRISESELNSYVRYDLEPQFPPGISKVQLQLRPGRPHGTTEVDFDKLKSGMKTPPNPLLSYFLSGVHTLGVEGTLSGSNGMAQFHLETVTLDGIVLPDTVVEFLIDRYLKPRYPNVAIDRPFALGFGIQKLEVQSGNVLLTSGAMSASTNPAMPFPAAMGSPPAPPIYWRTAPGSPLFLAVNTFQTLLQDR